MREKILFCDIDDVIINSAGMIQKYVEANTVFSSDVLKALEQFKRNCQYYYDCIVEEYANAEKEGRTPNLSRFPNLDIYDGNVLSKEDGKGYYRYPINSAIEYLKIATDLLDEFLEERDMFLELDNLPYGNKKNYDYEKEQAHLNMFKLQLYNNFDALEQINKFCLHEVQRISDEAKAKGEYPVYKALIQMDSNDIIRTNENMDDWNYRFYKKPYLDVLKCFKTHVVEYAIKNFDRKENYSKEIVDYDSIYIPENVNKEAIVALKKLVLSGKIDRLCFITHHNGSREEKAKRRLVGMIFPEADFLGMRFHSEEHNLVRRYRSSKYENASKKYDLKNNDAVLLDDSKDNCNNWHDNESDTIIYRKTTDAEKIGRKVEFDYPRIENFDDLEETLDKVFEKEKVKRLERK